MGKKRTHAETKDGFAKPEPDQGRLSAKKEHKKDQKKPHAQSQLVCALKKKTVCTASPC